MNRKVLFIIIGSAIIVLMVTGLVFWLRHRALPEQAIQSSPPPSPSAIQPVPVLSKDLQAKREAQEKELARIQAMDTTALRQESEKNLAAWIARQPPLPPLPPPSPPVLKTAPSPASTSTQALNTDSDQDGLTDEQELKLGTDPHNPDTDGDGYPDGEEVQKGYNPLGAGKASQ